MTHSAIGRYSMKYATSDKDAQTMARLHLRAMLSKKLSRLVYCDPSYAQGFNAGPGYPGLAEYDQSVCEVLVDTEIPGMERLLDQAAKNKQLIRLYFENAEPAGYSLPARRKWGLDYSSVCAVNEEAARNIQLRL